MNSLERYSSFAVFFAMAAALGSSLQADGPVRIKGALLKIVESVEVSAEAEGILSEVNAREGQIVSQGSILAKIRDEEARLKLQEAMTELKIAVTQSENDVDIRFAQKSLGVSQAELDRARNSVRRIKDSVSKSELDRLDLIVKRDELQIEQAERDHIIAKLKSDLREIIVSQRKAMVNKHLMTAPLDGMVVSVERSQGEWVNSSDAVVRIIRIDRLRVEGFLDASKATFDLVGTPVSFAIDLPQFNGEGFRGTVTFVSPDANPVNSQVRVWAEIDNRQLQLRPGLRGELTIHADKIRKKADAEADK